jgi:adenylate cyclase, class 2
MATEIEIKFLNINIESMIHVLRKCGGTLEYERLLRNTIFFTTKENGHEYIRVRDDSKVVSLTYKSIQSDGISTEEHEILVNSYEKTVKLLSLFGLQVKRIDEKKRRRYKLENGYVDIDFWPNIPPYIEIEALSKQDIKDICLKLHLEFDNRFKGDTLDVFRHYGIDPDIVKQISF